MTQQVDYYAIIGVSPRATPEEITVAFNRQVQRFPENARDPVSNSAFRLLVTAYKVLSNPDSRTKYDQTQATRAFDGPQELQIQFLTSHNILPALDEPQITYLLLDISADPSTSSEKPPLSLCLVIDRSTSMTGARMNQVKSAASTLVDQLQPKDSLTIVTFSDFAEVLIPTTEASNPQLFKSRISQISTEGGTEIFRGLRQGATELSKSRRLSGVNHLVLMTDGHTYGDEDPSIELAAKAAENGISISAMGIGDQWNDSFLDALVAPSGGTSTYLESPAQIVSELEKRLNALNHTYAHDMRLQLNLPPRITIRAVHTLSPVPKPVSFSNRFMPLGALQHDRTLSVLIELVVAPHPAGVTALIHAILQANIIPTRQRDSRFSSQLELQFEKDLSPSPPLPAILRAVNKLNLYKMNEKAWEEAEAGKVKEATQRLERLGSNLFSEGEPELAKTAFHEAANIARSGKISAAGRKKLKYGTRSLIGHDHLS
jgi:Ca-activated chloride channel family protein